MSVKYKIQIVCLMRHFRQHVQWQSFFRITTKQFLKLKKFNNCSLSGKAQRLAAIIDKKGHLIELLNMETNNGLPLNEL